MNREKLADIVEVVLHDFQKDWKVNCTKHPFVTTSISFEGRKFQFFQDWIPEEDILKVRMQFSEINSELSGTGFRIHMQVKDF